MFTVALLVVSISAFAGAAVVVLRSPRVPNATVVENASLPTSPVYRTRLLLATRIGARKPIIIDSPAVRIPKNVSALQAVCETRGQGHTPWAAPILNHKSQITLPGGSSSAVAASWEREVEPVADLPLAAGFGSLTTPAPRREFANSNGQISLV